MKKLLFIVCMISSYSYAVDMTGVFQDTLPPLDTDADGFIYTMTIDQTGRLLLGGQYDDAWVVLAYLADGTRDDSFGESGVTGAVPPPSIVTGIQDFSSEGGSIVAVGNAVIGDPAIETAVFVVYSVDGNPTFGELVITGTALGFTLDIVEGVFGIYGATNDQVPFLSDFSTTTTFESLAPGYISGFQVIDGSSYISGSANDRAFLLRLGDDPGIVQDAFPPFDTNDPAQIYGVLVDKDGNVVVCGNYNNVFTLVRYLDDGTRDESFGDAGVVQYDLFNPSNAYALIQDSDGNYYVAGEITVDATTVLAVAKYTNTGAPVTNFGTNGVAQGSAFGVSRAYNLALNSDTSLLAAGQVTVAGTLLPALVAYNSFGGRVATFGQQGVQTYGVFGAGSLNTVLVSGANAVAAGSVGDQATVVELNQSSEVAGQIATGF